MRLPIVSIFVLGMAVVGVCSAQTDSPADFSPNHFYTIRPDPRLCPSPMCGGYWVKRVNRTLTRCVDGTWNKECYVMGVRNAPSSGIGIGTDLLLRGRIRAREFGTMGSFGVFVIAGAWQAATDAPASGRYMGIENNGTVCITTPCFSWDEYVLNHPVVREISGIELGKVGASDEDLARVRKILANGGVLLAAGRNYQVEETAGTGLHFVASQFYLPMP